MNNCESCQYYEAGLCEYYECKCDKSKPCDVFTEKETGAGESVERRCCGN